MKGKIFKRVANAMLGLMVAVAAIGVNTAFAEDVVITSVTATPRLTNFHNDGTAKGDKCYFDVYINFVPDKAEEKGKTVKVTELAFNILTDNTKIDCQNEGATAFTRAYQTDFVGNVVVANDNQTIGYKYYKNPSVKSETMEFIAGQDTFLGTMTATLLAAPTQNKCEFKFDNSGKGKLVIKNGGTESKYGTFTLTAQFCAHSSDKATYTDINAKTHTLNCPDCKQAIVQDHDFTVGNEQAAQADANKLGGKGRKCKCGLWGWENRTRLDGAAAYLMPDGKTWISAYEGLNQIAVDIDGYKVIVQDALNKFKDKKLVLTATEAPADSAIRKNLAAKMSANGKVYLLALTADGTAVKADDIKEGGIRVLYQLPEGSAYDEYVQLLKDAGVTGDFGAKAEKVNDKEYVAVWTKTAVGPYVLPNGAAPAEKKEEKKSTTSKSGKFAKTGDAAGMVCLAASGLLVVAGLYMELMKKKKNA